ncbi:glycosyltransferase family 2 protein [Priestia megaterium]|uniref:glycosyltransferase family 2 protein n=1 Tax=Priestia megaterium TaxID=1404 RepID=UPI001168A59C|nr:glycosyltransferase [Priestia megaterium]MDC7769135.1 glycosyltransferase [Priestia megaterium]UYT86781.1 glycosyltransferase [Priestia megaterium]
MIKIDSYEYYYNPEDGKYYIRKRKNSTHPLKKLKDKLDKSKDKKDRKDKTSKGNRFDDADNKVNKSRDKVNTGNKKNKSRDKVNTANETNKSYDKADAMNETNKPYDKADAVNETNKLYDKADAVNETNKVDITDHSLYKMSVKNNHKHPIKVSIVMPTYNKYHQTSLSLYGLSKQTFPHAEYEVILVDDASSDNTSNILKEVDVPFKFKYIQMKQNKGRSSVRNIGINHAEGDLLIFLDGEMLAPPAFIENHYKHHVHESNLVVTGAMHYEGVYTFIMPDYNEDQVAHLKELVGRDPEYRRLYENYEQTKWHSNVPYPLVTKEDIDTNRFQRLSFPNRYFLNSGLKHFGERLEGFTLPYIAFLSGNVSVRKENLKKSGLFDETFVGYGAEDWELGYRLYKNGAQFVLDPSTVAYHQEHGISKRKVKEQWGNHYRFVKKHPNIDVLILSLEWKELPFMHLHQTLVEYKALEQRFPDEYKEFKHAFRVMLFRIIEYLNSGQPVTKLYDLPGGSDERIKIIQQFETLRPRGFDYLASSFEQIYYL